MQRTAEKQGVTPQAYVDQLAARFKAMGEALNCGFDRFIRTTDADHLASTQELWRRMEKNGDIYLAKYAGWYSVRDEAFYNEEETTLNADGVRLGGQGTPVEWVEERAISSAFPPSRTGCCNSMRTSRILSRPRRAATRSSALSNRA